MKDLSFIEIQVINRLFDISDGYVFKYRSDNGQYNKNITRQLISDACGIDIYNDAPYNALSQQRCIEKILESNDSLLKANLLDNLLKYYDFLHKCDVYWDEQELGDYNLVEGMIKRLREMDSLVLPDTENADIKIVSNDILVNFGKGNPELAIDRLHTFATSYIREVCQKHGIPVLNEKGDYFSIGTLIAKLTKWYEKNEIYDTEFCSIALKSSISVFVKFNDLRNDRSAAHPNKLLNKNEAEYVIRIVTSSLNFIDYIERNVNDENSVTEDFSSYYNDELPF